MKKTYLLSAMIGLGVIAHVNAMESRRPVTYKMMDSLIQEYIPFGETWKLRSKVHWPSVFIVLDLMNNTIGVNEYRSVNDETLLCRAVWGLNFLAVKTLLEKYKADSNIPCGTLKNTALHIAVIRKDVPIFKLLLTHGANPDIKNSLGQSSLDKLTEEVGKNPGDVDYNPDTYKKSEEMLNFLTQYKK